MQNRDGDRSGFLVRVDLKKTLEVLFDFLLVVARVFLAKEPVDYRLIAVRIDAGHSDTSQHGARLEQLYHACRGELISGIQSCAGERGNAAERCA